MKKFSEHLFDTVDQMEMSPELSDCMRAVESYMDTVVCPELEKLAGGAPAKPREIRTEAKPKELGSKRYLVKVEFVVRKDLACCIKPRAVYEDEKGNKLELYFDWLFDDWKVAEGYLGNVLREAMRKEVR